MSKFEKLRAAAKAKRETDELALQREKEQIHRFNLAGRYAGNMQHWSNATSKQDRIDALRIIVDCVAELGLVENLRTVESSFDADAYAGTPDHGGAIGIAATLTAILGVVDGDDATAAVDAIYDAELDEAIHDGYRARDLIRIGCWPNNCARCGKLASPYRIDVSVCGDCRRAAAARSADEPASEQVAGNIPADVLHEVAVRDSTQAETRSVEATRPAEPVELLIGWLEIIKALGRKDSAEERTAMKQLNKKYDGPIITKQGAKTVASRAKLVEWWNSLEQIFLDAANKQRDQSATTEGTYQYGKTATVVPEISGHIVKRRKTSE